MSTAADNCDISHLPSFGETLRQHVKFGKICTFIKKKPPNLRALLYFNKILLMNSHWIAHLIFFRFNVVPSYVTKLCCHMWVPRREAFFFFFIEKIVTTGRKVYEGTKRVSLCCDHTEKTFVVNADTLTATESPGSKSLFLLSGR